MSDEPNENRRLYADEAVEDEAPAGEAAKAEASDGETAEEGLTRIDVFLDGAEEPHVSFPPPLSFELDTTKLVDGEHSLRIEAHGSKGVTGVRSLSFIVRNGPSIAIHGIEQGATLEGKVPVLLNAYGGAGEVLWEPLRAETPAPIPTWIWVMVIVFIGFAGFYAIRQWFAPANFATTPTFIASARIADATTTVSGPASSSAAPQAASAASASSAASGQGEALFNTHCSACHQTTGMGLPGVFPPLAGDPVETATDPTEQITTVLNGKSGSTINGVTYAAAMPSFASQLSDDQIAQIINYERTSWGNNAPTITAADVTAQR